MKQIITKEQADDLNNFMKLAVGAAIVSLATSISTHHVTAVGSGQHNITPAEMSHMFEREREVLHHHSNLGRVRYATVSGTDA